MTEKPLISIVVPVFNEEENVRPLYERVAAVMDGLKGRYESEFVFTDNHSTDGTFAILKELAARDKRVRVLRFSKNFGFQRSIYTGYANARGAAAIQIDCDFQDPPELFPRFIEKWEQGYDVVYGIRRSRREGAWMNWMRAAFYRLIDALSEDELPHHAGDFRLVSRRVLDEIKRADDQRPYLRGMIAAFGFEQTGIPYDRDRRRRGAGKFSFGQLVSLSLDGILYHSMLPLRIATFTALVMAAATFAALVYFSAGKLFFDAGWPAGFAATTLLLLLDITLTALFLGVIGEYLGRIYQQVKRTQITIVEERLNDD